MTTLLSPPSTLVRKRGTYPLGSAIITLAEAGGIQWMQRQSVTLAVNSKRWRLKIANADSITNASSNQPATIDTVYIGSPAYATNAQWVGNTTAVMSLAIPATAASIPSSNAEQTTAWVETPALQFTAHIPSVISMAITIPAGGTGCIQSDALAYTLLGNNANVAVAVPGVTAGPYIYDIRVEYEADVLPTTPVGLYLSASDATFSPDGGGMLPAQCWPNLAGHINGHIAINAAISTTQTSQWTTIGNRPWTRFDLATYPPDYAILGPGILSNDIANQTGGDAATSAQITTSLGNTKTNVATILANFASLGTKRTYIATVPPRNFSPGGSFENFRYQLNAWIRTLPLGIDAIVDMEYAMRSPSNFAIIDELFVSSDDFHPAQAGQFLMASQAKTPPI